jgi:hypothetical protein
LINNPPTRMQDPTRYLILEWGTVRFVKCKVNASFVACVQAVLRPKNGPIAEPRLGCSYKCGRDQISTTNM